MEGYYIFFSFDFFLSLNVFGFGLNWFEQAAFYSRMLFIKIDKEIESGIGVIIRQMYKEFNSHALLRLHILRSLLHLFTLYLSQIIESKFVVQQNREREIVNQFMRLLKSDFNTKKAVCEYANALHISPAILIRL